jgi:NADP-dependent 3-hydroxy acid dehydrogenase YdfG
MTRAPRTALITGASSGIGHGLARWFAARDVHVYAAARRLPELEQLAERHPGRITPVQLDVADMQATVDRIRELDEECDGLDVVIANAGVGPLTDARRLDWRDVANVIEVNVGGAAATVSAVLPRMVERGRGQVVGVSSIAAARGLPKGAAYSASKAFLTTYLEGLRVDLAGTGVVVTTVAPGFIRTPSTTDATHPMPFILDLDDAVERIGRGIVRGKPIVTFPRPLVLSTRLLRLLPRPVYDLVARRMP